MKRYEGMFLFDGAAGHDWPAIDQEVRRLCERIGAQLQVCVKYDDRKLAFEIDRRKRGTYALAYFDAPSTRIGDLERDAQLSEMILRVLVLRTSVTPEKIAELKARQADVPLSPGGSEGRRHDDEPSYYGRRGRDDDRPYGRRDRDGEGGPPADADMSEGEDADAGR